MSGQLHAPGTQWTESWVYSKSGLDAFGEEKGLHASTFVPAGTGPTIRIEQDISPRPERTSERETVSLVV